MNEVTIGNQVWMTENLNVEKFRNGDFLTHAKTAEMWKKAGENGQPAWRYYDNDPSNGVKYGKLYNWYAVNDSRGVAPKGWHIPSDAEWTTLTEHLGGKDAAATKMKSTTGWDGGDNGTNESGFSGLPGGYRPLNRSFYGVGDYDAWSRSLSYDEDFVKMVDYYKDGGFSDRCLKD